ncbi:MAG: hypothetical protein NVS4B3_25720 [Gemmatimonadaceae bacterium]
MPIGKSAHPAPAKLFAATSPWERNPSVERPAKIATALGVPLAALFDVPEMERSMVDISMS